MKQLCVCVTLYVCVFSGLQIIRKTFCLGVRITPFCVDMLSQLQRVCVCGLRLFLSFCFLQKVFPITARYACFLCCCLCFCEYGSTLKLLLLQLHTLICVLLQLHTHTHTLAGG